jgi:Zn-dependent protease
MQHDLFHGVVWFIVFLFSTTLHEAGHAFAAWKLGDDTAHRGGQVTLDPIPHIMREPLGMILVPIISYFYSGWMIGWASAPYDPRWAHAYPKRAGIMAAAGPAGNLLLLILAGIGIRIGLWTGHFQLPYELSFEHIVAATHEGAPEFFAVFLSILFSLNVLLFFFNLLPLPPLDGSTIPLIFLPDRLVTKFWDTMRTPGISMIGIVIAWKIFEYVGPYLFAICLRLLWI